MRRRLHTLSKLAIVLIVLSLIICISLAVTASFNRDKIALIYDYAIRYRPNISAVAKQYVNIPYCNTTNPAQQLDLYIPKRKANAPHPLVVQIHGGGWRWGDKDNQIEQRYAPQLVEKGIAVAAVDYRLASEAVYPAQNQDIACALNYLITHATALNINPSKIGLMGDSAGGQLAAITGLDPQFHSNIKAVVMLYGVSDLWEQITQYNDENAVYYLGSKDKELAAQASPINANLSNAPPFLIIHGTEDKIVPASESEKFADKLRQSGDQVTYLPVTGAGHAFIGGFDFREAYVHDTIIKFFVSHLK